MSTFINIYDLIFKPTKAYKYFDLKFNRSLFFQALISIFLASIISSYFSLSKSLDIIFEILFSSTLIFLVGFVFKLERGDYFKLIACLSLANFPVLFKAPVDIISYKIPFLGAALSFALSIWILNLTLIGIATVCKISKLRAFLLLILPVLIILLALFVLFIQILIPFFEHLV